MRRLKNVCATLVALTTAVSPLALLNPAPVQAASYDTVSDVVFKDLHQAAPYAQDSIIGVKKLGFMSGLPNGEFRPYEPISREQIASILVRLVGLYPTAGDSGFFDVDKVDKNGDGIADKDKDTGKELTNDYWAKPYITTAYKAGMMQGSGNKFRPKDFLTRQELAVLLVRSVGHVDVRGKGARLTIVDKADVAPWAKDYVQVAMELGLVSGESTYFRPKELATRQDVAVMMMNLYKALKTDWSSISNMDNKTIVCNGVSYQIGEEVQGILNLGNREVLKNAKIRFVASNKKIVKITGLEIVTGGNAPSYQEFSSNVTLSGNNARIDGNLVVGADYVTVKNLTVTGDLHVKPALEHSLLLSNSAVQGKLILDGGTTKVLAENTRLNSVLINRENAYFETKGKTLVTDVLVSAKSSTVRSTDTLIPKLSLTPSARNIEISAPVTILDVKYATQIALTGNMRIEYVLLASGLKESDVFVSYSAARSLIGYINGAPVQAGQVPSTPVYGNVQGNVYKGSGGTTANLVPSTRVNIFREDNRQYVTSTVTNAAGAFGVQLPAGRYLVQADSQLADYADSGLSTVVVSEGSSMINTAHLVLQTPQIKGTILNGQGQPLAGALVTLTHKTLGTFTDTTNAQGKYAIGNLPLSDYTITISSGQATMSLPLSITTSSPVIRDYSLSSTN